MAHPRQIEFHGKKIVVVGLGISGLWTARYLAEHGAHAIVSEERPETDLDPDMCQQIRTLGINLESGGHARKTFLNADMIVISPGVPSDMALLGAARQKGIHVTGELELASRLIQTPIIAITGTNGKSTVTAALGQMLDQAGLKIFLGGNIGTPLMALAAAGEKPDYAVVEVSSFQLDTIETFCPVISVVLNISPDHLDRYPSYEDYARSKLKIFCNQKPWQHVILNDDDERLTGVNPSSGVSVLRYGLAEMPDRHAYIKDGAILACPDDRQPESFFLESYNLPGKHNLENLLAIILVSQLLGIDATVIQKNINGLTGLANRLEHVGEIKGISFYNDSKATNVDAAVRAVLSFDRPLVLIAGGRHKGAGYGPLVSASEKYVKKAIFLGEAKELLRTAFKGSIPFSIAEDMEDAVAQAFECAQRGDAVLLSPACASFDMFPDYNHRGNVFKSIVRRLNNG